MADTPNLKLVNLGMYANSGKRISVLDMLKSAVDRIEADPDRYNKAVILFLDDRDGYETGYEQAGMYIYEIIPLMEVIKAEFVDTIRGVSE
jgi:hypothetical protein